MRKYEIAFIVHPDLDDNAFKETLEQVKGWITGSGGTISKVDLWGKRRLAYEIRKQKEGQYVFLYAEIEPTSCSDLERNFQLLDPIMRFMINHAVELPAPSAPVPVKPPMAEIAEQPPIDLEIEDEEISE
ncbi:MAG: 30S ribosomal protein S6 [Anaerolineae bacterium]|nr:30S ribosomal protein S6 [Anaerolineae bacterium]